ncbi:ADP-forming succinate--CoA ligase subunit beta [Acanthopleuribacter pedis]|uniref:Succinate--CoA ligase [ADP-forming] subunit beta n=1 Tax=Acanthopleuribacter pedis TaxID=442870 RepID=A0A8J7U6Q2_9BACT|nr:ADP-forming succinate--CoA ligase subunit beta [Acanthopleuribacter pedis]MBO1322169.1 ADP-forming succinate--CoA ligase subunit beta [Acanthopleuribacter pedis]
MKVHEFQAKQVLARFGVPVPKSGVTDSVDEAVEIAKGLGGSVWVVKAQIHAGGRGKGGGVKLARSLDEVRQHAKAILGMTLVTHQTGPEGKLVNRILVEEGQNIDQELYFGIVIDRATSSPVIMASREGGMEIEEVAEENPDAILREVIDIATGMSAYQARRLAFGLGLQGKTVNKAVKLMMACYKAFEASDAAMLEINPLMISKEGDVVALDCKMEFDENAMFRHKDLAEMRDLTEEDAKEIEAAKFDLNYITLSGTVGCMVNGAGLAMATMDIIKHAGAEPANFLDVGGGATQERVEAAFKLILSDDSVKAVLINIFGGIVRCDMIARGVIEAAKNLDLQVPVVVRLEGTNAEEGLKLLEDSGLGLIPAKGLAAAATKVAEVAKGA